MLVVKSEFVKPFFEEKSVHVHGISKLGDTNVFSNIRMQMNVTLEQPLEISTHNLEVMNVNKFVKRPFLATMAIVSDRNQTMYSENTIFIVDKIKHNILSIVGCNDDKDCQKTHGQADHLFRMNKTIQLHFLS